MYTFEDVRSHYVRAPIWHLSRGDGRLELPAIPLSTRTLSCVGVFPWLGVVLCPPRPPKKLLISDGIVLTTPDSGHCDFPKVPKFALLAKAHCGGEAMSAEDCQLIAIQRS